MAAISGGDQVYATLLLNDTYLPGALVLAHSLRDAGTSKPLAVLVTLESVSAEVITELKAVYDHVIPVPRIRNDRPANLYLMNRPDLHSAFTKINLWRQTQFAKIVYIDADVVAYRAPDELFDIAASFSAAPDIGWPDLFNTGVMVLNPNMGDYYALIAMAERGISFDGADQGLLNMHFKNTYNRISFSYNVTPSAHYQYVPAYRHFQSSINMVHFIGPDKPWFQGRQASKTESPFEDMVGRWWAVYDRHYRASETNTITQHQPNVQSHPYHQVPELVQYFTKGEFQPPQPQATHVATTEQQSAQPERGTLPPAASPALPWEPSPPPVPTWDAQRQPPPTGSRPEALNFPSQVYVMSQDPAPFVPPERYPSPPRNMWYEVPTSKPAPPTQKPPPIFPWETNQPKPTRFFAEEASKPAADEVPDTPTGSSTTGQKTSEPSTPATPIIRVGPSDPWTAFTRTNAWDEVPEIERYVEGLQKYRRGRSQGSVGLSGGKEHGLRLTDFPSVVERPSLPVTPAPIHRSKFWGGGGPGTSQGEGEEELPAAQGVPLQPDWDPSAQLQKLAKQQSAALLKKLGGSKGPEGSSGGVVLSPQPVKGSVTTSIVRNLGGGDQSATAPTSTMTAPSSFSSFATTTTTTTTALEW
ncbi:Glycogenin-1 [Colletotrichum spinosum]|uniref:glycogenin glucosyltransferase n=1 Tax=Colletotrichum spinosum TaxID=1347390 RepID=A0A4R8PUP6_9PEZI|nr:Glycogenin-1 [Colletotrichum spinosum]